MDLLTKLSYFALGAVTWFFLRLMLSGLLDDYYDFPFSADPLDEDDWEF